MDRYRPQESTPRERFDALYAELVNDPHPVVEVGIPMRDGAILAADVYLPDPSQLPAPAIVTLNSGYDKSNVMRHTSPVTGRPEPRHLGFEAPWLQSRLFQQNGYVYVINDERGRGKSDGASSNVMRAGMPSPHGDGQDGYDVIEWVARQPWCNGKVGTTGGSMLGNSQLTTAYECPPSLTCIAPIAAGGYWLTERAWVNGCYVLMGSVSMAVTTRGRLMHNLDRLALDWQAWLSPLPLRAIVDRLDHAPTTDVLEHDRLDDWWRERMIDGKRRELAMPALHVAGWLDRSQLRGMLKGYADSRQSPAGDQQWLIVGPWTHGDAIYHPGHRYQGIDFGRQAAVELDTIKLDWFARWLRNDVSTWADVPKVNLFETGSNVWRAGDTWPLPGREEALYLTGDGGGGLSPRPAAAATTLTYRYDPRDPVMPTPWGRLTGESPLDQSYLDGRVDVLRYTSPEVKSELAVSGFPRLRFFASTDGDDTEWHLRLADVQPDGTAIELASTCLRASYRASLEEPSPLRPNEIYEFRIELTPITHAFLPGHRIRLTITSSDFPTYARSLNRFGRYIDLDEPRVAQNTLHHGAECAAQLTLPVTRGTVSALVQ